jgi:hypothetical protein
MLSVGEQEFFDDHHLLTTARVGASATRAGADLGGSH